MAATEAQTLDPRIANECARIVDALREALGPDLVAVALFGSWARGDAEEGSDIDMLLIANGLPERLWQRQMCLREPLSQRGTRIASFIALRPDEFLSRFPSFYLDIALDVRTLYDPTGLLDRSILRIRELIEESGLHRTGGRKQFFWNWKERPKGNWELTWEGLRELAVG